MRATLSLALFVAFGAVGFAQQNPYRLKDPDQRKLCIACHGEFEQTLKKKFVHSAVKSGECSSCHSPHVSDHSKLLSEDTRKICASCHDSVEPKNAKSVHKVVAHGDCGKCHDPHASDNTANLVANGNALCVGCHKQIGEAVKNAKFKHAPVEQGCVTCHAPHGSDKSDALLKSPNPGLCLGCHKADTAAFANRHMNYPVARAACTSCHDPHASDTPGLLYRNVHAPVAARNCSQCHEAANSPNALATKTAGSELCRQCHNDMVTTTLSKPRLHWPVADKRACLNCHNPHASKETKLLKASAGTLCTSCHADTGRRIAAVAVKHQPAQEGMCVACHSPHASTGTYLIDSPSVAETCGKCHDYSEHSAHPIGEKAIDPRNKNLRVDCESCHKAHGTPFKRMLTAPTNVELCTPCHKQYGR
jgi:predicted CXXCH cytochrome family protein